MLHTPQCKYYYDHDRISRLILSISKIRRLDAQDEALEQGIANFEDSDSRLDGIDEAG